MKRNIILFILSLSIAAFLGCHAGGNAPFINKEQQMEPVIAEGLPQIKVSGGTKLKGHFFISFPFTKNLIMMDGRGNIIWSKHEPLPEGIHAGLWDFKKHNIGGQIYYSYHDHIISNDNYGLLGFGPGERVILDANFNEIKRITFEQSDVTEKGHPVDGHDFLMIDLDHYILSGYIKETVNNIPNLTQSSSVVFSYLQEVQNGAVIWDWKSIDYPELYALTVTDADQNANDFENTNTDAPDYVHFNSMRINTDGNLVCSFRHLNSIICLDRHSKQNQILWKLSGKGDEFHLNEDEKSSCQHYAVIDNDYISIFDNGNKSSNTHIRSYKLNMGNKTAQVKTYTVPGKFSSACGSAQRIYGETYVIGWGITNNDAVCMSVYDFATNNELMSLTLAMPQNYTYRCVYYE